MSLFRHHTVNPEKARAFQGRTLFCLQVIGLCATGWLVWHVAVIPRLASQTLAGVLNGALECALIAACSSACIALGVYLIVSGPPRREAVSAALRTSATAIWFAPATILLSALSPAALCAALVLVVSTTRLLYSEWRRVFPPVSPEFTPIADPAFELPPSPLFKRDLIPGLTASFAVQAGIVAVVLGYALLSAILFCVAAVMFTLSTLVSGMYDADRPSSLPRSVFGVLLTVILAAGLTVGGLAIQYGGPFDDAAGGSSKTRPGPLSSAAELLRKLMHKPETDDPANSATRIFLPPTGNAEVTDKSFPGVVLWTEARPQQKLVAPTPSNWLNLTASAPRNPLSIVFTGQYWMFKAPYAFPPEKSLSERGTPLELSFVTTDHRAMNMEAHQKLDHPIDWNCCRGVQVDFWNADRYRGTIALELILRDSTAPGRPSQTLGSKDVTAWPQGNWLSKPVFPATEILEFAIPPSGTLRQFDEIEVIFRRNRVRIERSARISIERFILIPAT